MTEDRTLAELARDLPWRAPDAERTRALRDALVHEAQTTGAVAPRRSRRTAVVLMGAACTALVAAAVVLVVLWPRGVGMHPELAVSVPAERGTVRASAAADFVHTSRMNGGVHDEVVRVRGGRVSVTVDPLGAGERFRVVTGDGEVEVRGTSFDVEVVADRLQSVAVEHGVVEVRLDGETVALLHAGESWTREVAHVEEPVETPPMDAPAVEPVKPVKPSAAPATPTEAAFRDGREALRSGDFATAADAFARAVAADPAAPLAEDARYWRGVALARAGRDADAAAALADFLDRHPTSLHAGRASLVLGNLLLRSGDTAAARARFDAARNDGDPEVRAAAEKAVSAIVAP